MREKYLPIGTICSLKGKNKKVMITGFYSVEFDGNFKINDYIGCTYPEGMLLPNQTCTFNHTDIENIDYIGYESEEQNKFLNLLNRLTGNENEEEKAKKFHEDNEMFLTSNSAYSKLLFDENGVVMIAELAPKKEENKLKNIKFDETGTVISAGDNDITNPFYKEYKVEEKKEVSSEKWNIFKNIKFDENGTVISDEKNEKINETKLNKIKFDENGVVISVGEETVEENRDLKISEHEEANNVQKYEFDENGNVIVAPINSLTPVEQAQPPFTNIQFDENGTVVSAE